MSSADVVPHTDSRGIVDGDGDLGSDVNLSLTDMDVYGTESDNSIRGSDNGSMDGSVGDGDE